MAAVAFLKGDSQQIIEDTVSNGLANTSGIVCDGAHLVLGKLLSLSIVDL